MTILSTSLKNLARRGFNVERILSARKAEREAADERMRQERAQAQLVAAQALVSPSEPPLIVSLTETLRLQSPDKLATYTNQLQQLFPDADPAFLARTLQQAAAPHVENAANAILAMPDFPRQQSPPNKDSRPPSYQPSSATAKQTLQSATMASSGSSDRGLFSSIKRQFARPESRDRTSSNGSAGLGAGGSSSELNALPPPPLGPRASSMIQSTAPAAPTDTDVIRSNVRKAIQVCQLPLNLKPKLTSRFCRLHDQKLVATSHLQSTRPP